MATQTAYGATSQLQVLPPVGEATYDFLNHRHHFPDTRLKPAYTRLICHFCDKRWVLIPHSTGMAWEEYPNNLMIQWDDPEFA